MHEPVNRLLATLPAVAECCASDSRTVGIHGDWVAFASNMTTILVMSDTLPLAEVKAKFSEMVDRVEAQHDRITVTRNGRPAAVLMSPDDLASLEDTLDLLSNPQAVAELAVARTEAAAGTTVSADDLRAKYLRG